MVLAGVVGGFINTVAGGGAMVTVPALMLLGMPADHANGTYRLGLLQQSLTGIGGFSRSNMLDREAILPMVLPTISGAAVGALATTWLHPEVLKPVPFGSMIAISVIMLILPEVPAPQDDARVRRLRERPLGFVMLVGAGVYGGLRAGRSGLCPDRRTGGGVTVRFGAGQRPEGRVHGAAQRSVPGRIRFHQPS